MSARYWEPEQFVKACLKSEESQSSAPSVPLLFGALSLFSVLNLVVGLPLFVAGIIAGAVLAIGHFLLRFRAQKSGGNGDVPVKGTGGRKVSVQEMHEGGSGSASVLSGVTVAHEKYQAKVIINCAGGNVSFHLSD